MITISTKCATSIRKTPVVIETLQQKHLCILYCVLKIIRSTEKSQQQNSKLLRVDHEESHSL